MLIEFNVTNYLSIRETQSLTMSAAVLSELGKNRFDTKLKGLPNLLRSAAIYGPNASGKSNLVMAMEFMKEFVESSSKEMQEGESINVIPFLFERESRSSASEFEAVFIKENVRYQYGFSVTLERVVHEWLFAYPEGRAQRWFERQYDEDTQHEVWYFGPKFKGNRKVLRNATRTNALFLSTAIQLNNEYLKPVFKWFNDLRVVSAERIHPEFTIRLLEDNNEKRNVIDFMNAADLSISDILVDKKELSIDELPEEILSEMDISTEEIQRLPKKKSVKAGRIDLSFLHLADAGDELIPIDFKSESAGTKKLFELAGPWLNVLEDGIILVIDEFDRSLHPLISRFLVELINDPTKSKNNAQLIFTTHDTTILDKELLRRDQIWFMEKDEYNSTQLYPLTDFKPRKGEALQKGYLQGRYGALPFVGDIGF